MARTKSGPEIVTQEVEAEWEAPTRREALAARPSRSRTAQVKAKPTLWGQLRFWAGWALAVVVLLAVILGLLEFEQFLRHDQRFRLVSPVEVGEDSPSLQVQGVTHASRREISKLFERDFGRSLYGVPVAQRRDELKKMDWVQEASVTRIWPNVVKVEIVERQPVAFAALVGPDSLTETMLIDADGVVLRMPEQAKFSLPVVTGMKRTDRIELRKEKISRVRQVLKESGSLADRISELDIAELNNVKVTIEMERHAVTVFLGNRKYQQRLESFLKYYDEIHRNQPSANKFDARLDNRIDSVVE